VRRFDALVVVLNQLPLRKTELTSVEPDSVNVRHLYVKANFLQLMHAPAVLQHRTQKLGPNAPPSIRRQHSECHYIKPLILRLDSRANCPNEDAPKVSELA
jgi:hypothetical protein